MTEPPVGAVVLGDCVEVLAAWPEACVDAIVTDPPYHLGPMSRRRAGAGVFRRAHRGFMGKSWDGGDVSFRPETWAAILRVLRPGGQMVAFGGTRTYHRMVCAAEDAGFEVRDQIAWLFGSSMPKSLDVSRAIDRAAGAERDSPRAITGSWTKDDGRDYVPEETTPTTDAAREWQGWGTALKPAMEPILLARRPLAERSVAANVLAHGTGAINIDGTRIAGPNPSIGRRQGDIAHLSTDRAEDADAEGCMGRYPANVVLSHAEECREARTVMPDSGTDGGAAATWECDASCPVLLLDAQSAGRMHGAGAARAAVRDRKPSGHLWQTPGDGHRFGDTGGASRFFYTAKADSAERIEGLAKRSHHPTTKPVAILAWLVRLVTPPGGIVLDPFLGSGTTAIAAQGAGFRWVGIEMDRGYAEIAVARVGMLARLEVPQVAS